MRSWSATVPRISPHRPSLRGLAVALLSIMAFAQPGSAAPGTPSPAERDYLLACGGCHGFLGASNSRAVPQLKGLVGYYLNTAQGRSYLPRLPNVAFAPLNDEALAAVLNYVVFDFGGSSVPAGAPPYDAAEVARWRARPLTDVPLTPYRRRLVASLIERYRAPANLGDYDKSSSLSATATTRRDRDRSP